MLMVPFLLLSLPLSAQDVLVLEVKGTAEMRSGVDQAWAPLKAGDEIPEGAWIQTALKSLVYIKFWTNTVAQIKSASLVQVRGLSNDGKRMTGRIHLALGSARVRVHPERTVDVDFKIVAPKMTTSIKGTIAQTSIEHFGVTGSILRGGGEISGVGKGSTSQTPGVPAVRIGKEVSFGILAGKNNGPVGSTMKTSPGVMIVTQKKMSPLMSGTGMKEAVKKSKSSFKDTIKSMMQQYGWTRKMCIEKLKSKSPKPPK